MYNYVATKWPLALAPMLILLTFSGNIPAVLLLGVLSEVMSIVFMLYMLKGGGQVREDTMPGMFLEQYILSTETYISFSAAISIAFIRIISYMFFYFGVFWLGWIIFLGTVLHKT
jgi:hypothetical protein